MGRKGGEKGKRRGEEERGERKNLFEVGESDNFRNKPMNEAEEMVVK